MPSVIHYTGCPACGSSRISFALSAKDHTVSGESFDIWHCNHCTLRFTQDVPDEDSIGRYYQSENYISHSDTSKGLVNRLYQAVRKRTLRQKKRLVQKNTGLAEGHILDIGSGTGAFANEMKAAGWQVTALEPDEGARKIASERYQLESGESKQLHALPPASFDAITLWHVLEHVHQLHQYIERLKDLLKPAGVLIIAVPNYSSADAGIYNKFWAAYDVPRHLYHFSPLAMKILVEKHAMRIEKYLPMWFDSFYISMLSSKYKNGSVNLPASFFNGLRSNLKALLNNKKSSSVIYIVRRPTADLTG
jgi:2-polyprenyl-3-methyl-5-hydroxy-6-metoxy-1,4-benzoquinol methylase